MSSTTFPLLFMGNPLLDLQVTNGESLLEKYELKSNDAILADEKHMPIYDEVVKNHNVTYVAGGAAQNAARAAAYVLPENSVVYTGCVGDDDLAEQLKGANKKESVESAYLVKKGEQTGACAVVITGHDRSLVTTLRAAEKFQPSHLTETIPHLVDAANVYYVGGFFLTHGVESVMILAKKASTSSKILALNLSAPFIPQFFKAQLEQVLPYADIIIGNESEAAAYASSIGLPESAHTDLPLIAKNIAEFTKINAARPRIVVITHGAEETVLVSSESPDQPKIFSVNKLAPQEIVDTNGAGDAFAGGFVAAFSLGKTLEECVQVGHRMGAMCVGQIGPQWQWPKVTVL